MSTTARQSREIAGNLDRDFLLHIHRCPLPFSGSQRLVEAFLGVFCFAESGACHSFVARFPTVIQFYLVARASTFADQ